MSASAGRGSKEKIRRGDNLISDLTIRVKRSINILSILYVPSTCQTQDTHSSLNSSSIWDSSSSSPSPPPLPFSSIYSSYFCFIILHRENITNPDSPDSFPKFLSQPSPFGKSQTVFFLFCFCLSPQDRFATILKEPKGEALSFLIEEGILICRLQRTYPHSERPRGGPYSVSLSRFRVCIAFSCGPLGTVPPKF